MGHVYVCEPVSNETLLQSFLQTATRHDEVAHCSWMNWAHLKNSNYSGYSSIWNLSKKNLWDTFHVLEAPRQIVSSCLTLCCACETLMGMKHSDIKMILTFHSNLCWISSFAYAQTNLSMAFVCFKCNHCKGEYPSVHAYDCHSRQMSSWKSFENVDQKPFGTREFWQKTCWSDHTCPKERLISRIFFSFPKGLVVHCSQLELRIPFLQR